MIAAIGHRRLRGSCFEERLGMRIKNLILNVISLVLVLAGLALAATFFVGPSFLHDKPTAGKVSAQKKSYNVPVLNTKNTKAQHPAIAKKSAHHKKASARAPKNKTLWMTIPAMSRIHNVSVPYASGNDSRALKYHAAVHLKGTGFPWQKTANVYIAGHRLGYVGTKSLLAFYDLNVLKGGDKVYITDANGTKYTYRVFKEFTVSPRNLSVTKPKPGKNIVTLQTCTLPDYSHRLIVQARLVKKTKKT